VVFMVGSASAKITRGNTSIRIWQSNTVTPGKLYKITFWTMGDGTRAGQYSVYDVTNTAYIVSLRTTGVTRNDLWTQVEIYFTAPTGCVNARLYLYGPNSAGYAHFDEVSFQEVTHVGADGVHIVSNAAGAVRNWASIESGFNYNDSSGYTYQIRLGKIANGSVKAGNNPDTVTY
jgi:hypothetical protein